MSRHSRDAIFRPVLLSTLNRTIALAVCVCVVLAGVPAPETRAGDERPASPPPQAAEDAVPLQLAASARVLRDAVPVASFVAAPPDTGDDDFFLPEETDKKKLIQDIAVFVIVAVFVAFFIIKVFIEKDEDTPPDDGGGKPIPNPQ